MEGSAQWWGPAVALTRRFWSFAGWRAWRAVALMIAGAALEGVGLALIVPLMTLLMRQGGEKWHVLLSVVGDLPDHMRLARLAVLLCLFVVVMAMRALVLSVRDRLLSSLQLDFADRERLAIVSLLAGSRWRDIAGLRHARVTHVLGSEIPRVIAALQLILTTLTSAIMLLAQWVLVLILAPAMAVLALAVLVAAFAASGPMLGRVARVGQEVQQGQLSILDRVGQLMGGLKLALAQNMQAAFVEEVEATLLALNLRQQELVRRQTTRRSFSTVGAALALGTAALMGTFLGIATPILIAALTILSRMSGPAIVILRGVQQMAGLLPAYRSLDDLRCELARAAAEPVAIAGRAPRGPIRFEGVGYRHAQGNEPHGIRDVSLVIEPGEVVGVTGVSGAGKTSFVDLLSGLLAPDTGTIRVGDVMLTGKRMAAWRARIAYVAQDGYLFHDTIRRNLVWGLREITEQAIWEALDLAGAAALVRALPDGLETLVGERGGRLSGGERQRLALARAILRKPELLILDEATNALDIAAERRLLGEVTAIRPRPTVIIIAHRREALEACTRILRFDEGRLVADSSASAFSASQSR